MTHRRFDRWIPPLDFPGFGFHFRGPWGFPSRRRYLRMLERYKEELEAELKEVEEEIRELKGEEK